MGLLSRRPALAMPQYALASSPGTLGTTVTASGSTNTKGSWTQLIASTDFEVHGITLAVLNNNTAGAQVNMLIDIGVGGAGSEVVRVANLMISGQSPSSLPVREVFLPIFVPKGARISARCQSNVASKTAVVAIWAHGGGDGPAWPVFQGAEMIGADTSTSRGVSHTTGVSNTFSSWANLGSPSSRPFKAVVPMCQMGSDATMGGLNGYFEMGVASVAFGRWYFQTSGNEAMGAVIPSLPIFRRFPSGTQFMMRATIGTGTADDNYDFGLLGLY